MELDGIIHILVGSTCGLVVRMFIKYIPGKRKLFSFDNTLIVNVLASLFLGIFIALNITNQKLLLFVSVGFLGCLSTFSSFIYELFSLLQKRKYLYLFLYYLEVLLLSFIFFYSGYLLTLIVRN